ncbi:hypothetical protein [Pseudooceanicola sp. 200-1SW]|uniref:hypothetical protein n=1 Tax=Pseudooceanicola sp. 200-1SW TaxID=3425949 RepID=UPI003D7FEE33
MQKNLVGLVRNDPRFKRIYDRARASRSRVTSVYDISSRCNLFCEGCLFFNRDGTFEGDTSGLTAAKYDQMFAGEKQRGVTYPLLAGAEPSLEQKTLRIASTYWQNGMVHTNGIKPIDPALPFRLYVSVWGARELTAKWRGADCYEKTLKSAAADPRAIMNYTINSKNIDDIYTVVSDCARLGLQITFQVYSPTADYSDYLSAEAPAEEHLYIQGEDSSDNLILTEADDLRAHQAICTVIDDFPETVVFTKALSRWIFASPVTFADVPEDGTAPAGCFAGRDPQHQHRQLGGKVEDGKSCGHPSINCRTCRAYTMIFPTFFAEKLAKPMSREEAMDFLDAHHVFDVVYEGHRGEVTWHPRVTQAACLELTA